MKQDLYSNVWVSAENRSTKLYPKASKEEVIFVGNIFSFAEKFNVKFKSSNQLAIKQI